MSLFSLLLYAQAYCDGTPICIAYTSAFTALSACFVVRMISHFAKDFNVLNGVVSVNDEDGAHIQMKFFDQYAVSFAEAFVAV